MKFTGKLKTEFDDFARAISDVVQTDVIITDADMNVIGSAFQYFSLYRDIKIGSLIAEVFYGNRDVLVEHKRERSSCHQCPEFAKCKMEGFVGVPVQVDDRTVGSIALILPKERSKHLFKTIGSTMTFMHSMAELVASKIIDKQYSRIIEEKNKELKGILDASDAALAYTDFYGNILFLNDSFKKMFWITEDLLGMRIQELFPYEFITETFHTQERKSRLVKAAIERNHFYGIVNIKPIISHERKGSIMFTFRKYSEIQRESIQFTYGSYITFDYLKGIYDEKFLEEARQFAQKNDNIIFVNTDDNEINELIAKAIHNESSRKLKDILIMHSSSIYQDYLGEYLFGEDGLLKNIHDGTIIIHNPERIQIYYQNQLADIMGKLESGSSRDTVRLIICTDKNLQKMSEDGEFSPLLYGFLKNHTLRTEKTVHTDLGLFSQYIRNMENHYCRIYHKANIGHPIDLEDCRRFMGMEINALNLQIEKAVMNGGHVISNAELPDLSPKEYELNKIRKLIAEGKKQNEICKKLSISRSTLNRRLAEIRKQV